MLMVMKIEETRSITVAPQPTRLWVVEARR